MNVRRGCVVKGRYECENEDVDHRQERTKHVQLFIYILQCKNSQITVFESVLARLRLFQCSPFCRVT